MVKLVWSGLLCLLTGCLLAQRPLFTHQQWYRVEDGLPQSFVVGIQQDNLGFIWVSTRDGLARFDGRNFKVWQSDPRDPATLASNVGAEMFRLDNGKFILLFQGNAVDEFDPISGKVRHLMEDPVMSRIFQKDRGYGFANSQRWFYHREGVRGLGSIEINHPERDIFYNQEHGLVHGDSIIGSYLHADGRLWMVSPWGIYLLPKGGDKPDWYPFDAVQSLSKPYRVRPAEVYLAWKEWLVISAQNAIFFWNIHTHQLRKMELEPFPATQYTYPTHFQEDEAGYFYFRQGASVYRLEKSKPAPELVWENRLVPGRAIIGCLVDRTGVLWVGLDAAGLVKVNLKTMPLSAMPYQGTFHQTIMQLQGLAAGKLPSKWLDTRYGSYYFRYAYDHENGLYATYSFGTPVGDRQIFYIENGQFHPLPMPPGFSDSYFRGISFDSSGGIFGYNENGHSLFYWKDRTSMPEVQKLISLGNTGSFSIADAKMIRGVLWLSTYGEGLIMVKDKKAFANFNQRGKGSFNLPDNLSAINPDPLDPDIIWIGSLGGGLIKMHVDKGVQKILTTEDGLPNNTVYCMENDRLGNIWLTTNKGLVRFTPSTGAMQTFYKSDGLPGNEFNRSHSFRFSDGRLAFGGPDGCVILNPADYKPPKGAYDTRLTLTGIDVNGKPLNELTDTNLLRQPISKVSRLTLPYNQNYIGVSFAALLFNEPQNIKYRYRLLPDENEWNESGNSNYARYTQLQPGAYTLEINASGLDGKFTSEIRRLSIEIRPPVWQTWYAWVVYFIVGGLLIYIFLRNRMRQMQFRQQVAFEHREAARLRELDKMRQSFFDNITHELRTPLTLIKTPLDELSGSPHLPAAELKTIETARRNSQSLLRLINQLLDIGKLEAGQMKAIPTVGEPLTFIRQCLEPFESHAAAKGVLLEQQLEGPVGNYAFDADKWEKILFNLVSNAIKFTPAGGKVVVSMTGGPDGQGVVQAVIKVVDTGIGMSAEDKTHVFDRYFRARRVEGHFGGTGIGLALVKELVKLLGGDIEVASRLNEGTVFSVFLPLLPVEAGAMDEAKTRLEMSPAIPVTNGIKVGHLEAGEPYKLLVAEDHDDLRVFIGDSLSGLYTVNLVSNGQDAWDWVKQELPDLVITDMTMPGMDGNELCRSIKQNKATAHIPVIMLTSRTAEEARLLGRGAGADNYLTKPFQLGELKLCIRNLLEQQERQRNHWKKEMSSALPAIPSPADEFISGLYRYLDDHLDDLNLGVENLAGEMGVSKSTLNRKLQSTLGVSANDFIRQYRLKKAAAFLLAGYDAGQAAYKSGFSSPSYFSQRFREFFGKTPSAYASDGQLTQN